MENEIVLFSDGDVNVEVQISPEQQTVWLTQKQMEELFEVKYATISEHISNILSSGELDETSVGFSDKSTGGRKPKIYNLNMILSVGYRVNSKRGIAFRRWANRTLKQYIIQGYAINEKRLAVLQKTVDIQTKMLACTLDVEEADVLRAVNLYKGGEKRISDGALVAITLMIAESNPEEKDIMVKLVMNLLTLQINVILGGW